MTDRCGWRKRRGPDDLFVGWEYEGWMSESESVSVGDEVRRASYFADRSQSRPLYNTTSHSIGKRIPVIGRA